MVNMWEYWVCIQNMPLTSLLSFVLNHTSTVFKPKKYLLVNLSVKYPSFIQYKLHKHYKYRHVPVQSCILSIL